VGSADAGGDPPGDGVADVCVVGIRGKM
jgi:hypothetical protein